MLELLVLDEALRERVPAVLPHACLRGGGGSWCWVSGVHGMFSLTKSQRTLGVVGPQRGAGGARDVAPHDELDREDRAPGGRSKCVCMSFVQGVCVYGKWVSP